MRNKKLPFLSRDLLQTQVDGIRNTNQNYNRLPLNRLERFVDPLTGSSAETMEQWRVVR